MKVQHSIKKVGAVAGSVLMAGFSVGAAAPLADFPEPFVEDGEIDSQVVVGTNAAVADVVGAVDVAAAVGQSAVQTTEETVEGEDAVEVDGVEFEDLEIGSSQSWEDLDSFEVPQLRDTEFDDEDNRMEEFVDVDADFNPATDDRDEFSSHDVVAQIEEHGIVHKIFFDDPVDEEVAVPFGEDGEELTFLGQDGDDAVFGETAEDRSMTHGDSIALGPYDVEITNYGSDWLEVTVSKDGDHLTSEILDEGEDEWVDDDDLNIHVQQSRINIDDELVAHIELTWENTVFELDEETPLDENFDTTHLDFDDGNLTEMEFASNTEYEVVDPEDDDDDNGDEEDHRLYPGDAAPGFLGLYDVTYHGLDDTDTEDLEVGEDYEVTWTDDRETENTVDLLNDHVHMVEDVGTENDDLLAGADGDVVEGEDLEGTKFEVQGQYVAEITEVEFTDDNEDEIEEVTIEVLDRELTWEVGGDDNDFGDTQRVIRNVYVTLNTVASADNDALDDAALQAWHNNDDAQGEMAGDYFVTAHEAVITFEYDGGEDPHETHVIENWAAQDDPEFVIVAVYDEDDDGEVEEVHLYDDEEDETYTTLEEDDIEASTSYFGSQVSLNDDVSVTYPSERVHASASVGAAEVAAGEDVTYDTVDWDAQGHLDSLGMLDEEETETVKEDNHLILVGGPAVNTLVAELAEDYDDVLTQEEYQDEGAGFANIQHVSDAFTEDRDALIVAGHSADDTRAASAYLANYGGNAEAFEGVDDTLTLREADHADLWD